MKRSDSLALLFMLILPIVALTALAWWLNGITTALIVCAIALVSEAALFYRSDQRLLKSFGAREITDEKLAVVSACKQTARIAGIPTPKLYLSSSKAPNALTIGMIPGSAVIVVTEGLLETLSKDEQEGVVAHEIAHIACGDVTLTTMLATMTTIVSHLAGSAGFAGRYTSQTATNRNERHAFIGLLSSIAAPIAAAMIQLAISRNREFKADRVGAGLGIRYEELASALEKIHSAPERVEHDDNPHLAHLFIYASFKRKFFSRLFSTHPPISERIERLRELALTGGGVEVM